MSGFVVLGAGKHKLPRDQRVVESGHAKDLATAPLEPATTS